MRMLKIPTLVSLLILAFAAVANGQIIDGYTCTNAGSFQYCPNLGESSIDTVDLVNFKGKPGDTVWLPVSLSTKVDTVSGFFLLIEWDQNYLTPYTFPAPDESFVRYELVGRLLDAENSTSKNVFFSQISQNPADEGAIIAAFNLGFSETDEEPLQRLNPGSGVIFRLGFIVNAAMPDGSSENFDYWEVNEYFVTDEGALEALCFDCRRSNLSVDRTVERQICVDSSISSVDTTVIPWDTSYTCNQFKDTLVTQTFPLYPTTANGAFTADNTPDPTIESFTSLKDTVGPGETIVLSWSTSNADSIIIEGPSETYVSFEGTGQYITSAPTALNTYTYYLTADNTNGSAEEQLDIVVISGGGPDPGDNIPPVIAVNSFYSVDVGGVLNFTVAATDADGDVINLSASNLPNNASFSSASGTGSVTSSFSFTPDISQVGGTYTVTFSASDGTATTNQSVVISVADIVVDKLFSSSTEGSADGALRGKKSMFPINLATTQTVYGVQFDFIYDPTLFEVLDVHTTDNTLDYVVYQNIGSTPGTVRIVAFGMANEPIGSVGTDILMVEMGVETDALPGRYPIYLEDAWESVNPDPNFPGLELETDSGLFQVDMYGDVNLDLRVNVADLVSTVGYIIGDYGLTTRQFDVGDVNTNGSVDVFDLVDIIGVIYGDEIQPAQGLIVEDALATVSLNYNDMRRGSADNIVVASELPLDVAGVELEILYDPSSIRLGAPKLSSEASELAMLSRDNDAGRLKVLMYSTDLSGTSGLIRAGSPNLVEIPVVAVNELESGDISKIRINKALLSTAEATALRVEGMENSELPTSFTLSQNYPNPFNPSTTIEFTLGAPGSGGSSQRVILDIFNILGQNVNTLLDQYMPTGTHQVVWNGADSRGQSVATGIYLYRLQVGQESETKKMLLLK